MTLVHFPSMAVRPSGLMIACSRVKLLVPMEIGRVVILNRSPTKHSAR